MFRDMSILVSIHLTLANRLLCVVEFFINIEPILSSLGSARYSIASNILARAWIPLDSGLIFSSAGSVLVSGREKPLL